MLERREHSGERQNPTLSLIPMNVSWEYKNWGRKRRRLGEAGVYWERWESIVYPDGFQMMRREAEPHGSPSACFKDPGPVGSTTVLAILSHLHQAGVRVIQVTFPPHTHLENNEMKTVEAGDIPQSST